MLSNSRSNNSIINSHYPSLFSTLAKSSIKPYSNRLKKGSFIQSEYQGEDKENEGGKRKSAVDKNQTTIQMRSFERLFQKKVSRGAKAESESLHPNNEEL